MQIQFSVLMHNVVRQELRVCLVNFCPMVKEELRLQKFGDGRKMGARHDTRRHPLWCIKYLKKVGSGCLSHLRMWLF